MTDLLKALFDPVAHVKGTFGPIGGALGRPYGTYGEVGGRFGDLGGPAGRGDFDPAEHFSVNHHFAPGDYFDPEKIVAQMVDDAMGRYRR